MISLGIQRYLKNLKDSGLYRERFISGGEKKLNFSSNDYLSLRDDPQVKQAFIKGFKKYATGSGASMVISGYHAIHREVERTFTELLAVEDAILFNSGYTANLALMAFFSHFDQHLLIDKGVHASIYDGIKLAKTRFTRFIHNNFNDLKKKSMLFPGSVILTEGIFSMSGQQPDLFEMARLCSLSNSVSVIDEAHAFGILGPHGLGAVAHYGLTEADVPLRMIAFGKALGVQGAIIVGRADWIDALLQCSRAYIYTTGMSPALAYGLLESLSLLYQADDRRVKLFENITYFRKAIQQSSLRWRNSTTPIQQLQLSCPHEALRYAIKLKELGIICQAMREPTISRRETGLRVVLNAHHDEEDIDKLLAALQTLK